MAQNQKLTRSLHHVLAQELSAEDLDQVAGGDCTHYTTYDEPGQQIGRPDCDVGGTWKWPF